MQQIDNNEMQAEEEQEVQAIDNAPPEAMPSNTTSDAPTKSQALKLLDERKKELEEEIGRTITDQELHNREPYLYRIAKGDVYEEGSHIGVNEEQYNNLPISIEEINEEDFQPNQELMQFIQNKLRQHPDLLSDSRFSKNSFKKLLNHSVTMNEITKQDRNTLLQMISTNSIPGRPTIEALQPFIEKYKELIEKSAAEGPQIVV